MVNQGESAPRYYYRFTPGKRLLHATMFSTFLGLALTGLTLKFSYTGWARGFAHIVGGLGAILFFHKACAVVLTAAFLIHVGNVLHMVFVEKKTGILWGPESMVPQPRDFKQILAHFRWFLGLGPKPQFDRFGYWEKFDYWAVFWGMTVIGLSGYSMWFAPFVAKFIPGSWFNVALLLHGDEALLAVWFIFTIHFFNTHLRPGSFPMDMVIFTGRMTEEEFVEKHPAEYERLVKQGKLKAIRGEVPQRWSTMFGRIVGFAAIATGFVLLLLTLFSFRF